MLLDNKTALVDNTTALLDNKTVLLESHTMLTDIHRNLVGGQERTDNQHQSVSTALCYAPNNSADRDRLLDSSQVSDR